MATEHPLEIEHLTEDEAAATLQQSDVPVGIRITTGLGQTYNLKVTPLNSRPILIAVHL